MNKNLTAQEVTTLLRTIMTSFRLLAESKTTPVAGIIFENSYFDAIKRMMGPDARPYIASGIDSDPQMENSFVVDGILMLRGTPIADINPNFQPHLDS
jgi:hypothetical protein